MRKKTLPGTTSISPGLAQTLEDVGLEAALDAFEIAFPAVNLTVEVEADGDEDDEEDEREVADLSFTHYLPDADAGEDFLVTALSHRGERWLDHNMDTTLPDEDQESVRAGNSWPASQAEFNQLLEKAKNDGLLVSRETVDCTADGIEAVRVLNALVATGRFRVAVVNEGLVVKVVRKGGTHQLMLMRVAEDGTVMVLPVAEDERSN